MLFSRQRLKAFAGALLLAPAMACALASQLPSEPPPGLDVAWFHDDCAPWDGPALSLYLSPEEAEPVFQSPFPHLRVTLYANRTTLRPGERMQMEIPGNQGHAAYCEEEGACEAATSMAVEFLRSGGDEIEGRLEVLFANRDPVRGSFRARQLPFHALCG